MPILARGYRVEPIVTGMSGELVAAGFQVAWIGFAAGPEPEPEPEPEPAPAPSPRNLGGGGGGRWPRRPRRCPPDAPELPEDAPDLAAHMLAARLDTRLHAAVVIRLAWRMRRRRPPP